jgi:DNA invertase Pin-like site-specific DNA recombinase
MEQLIQCAIYVRVSTDQQGDSIENQISQCREYISRMGEPYDPGDPIIYRDEAVSGYYTSVFERSEMKRAIRDARAGKFGLLVFKEISRVGRDKQENPAIIGMFEQYGVRVIAINDNYDSLNKDNITFDILSVLSEQESKKISARVSSARRQKARRGEWSGEPPIGYRVDPATKKLTVDPETSPIPKLVFDLYVNQGLGTFKIAEYLNRHGFVTRNGNRWSRETVNKLLRNPAYTGRVVYGTRRNMLLREYDDDGKMSKKKVQVKTNPAEWQIVDQAHEALIDPKTFDQAQAILKQRSKPGASRRVLHPLTGILVCGRCGQGMVCQKRTYQGKEYRYYICKTYHKYGRTACSQRNVNADRIEQEIARILRSRLERLPHEWFEATLDPEQDLTRIEQELRDRQVKIERWTNEQQQLFRQRDLFAEEAYHRQMTALKRQIEYAACERKKLELQRQQLLQTAGKNIELSRYAAEFIRLLQPHSDRLRLLLHELIRRIVVIGNHLVIEYEVRFES